MYILYIYNCVLQCITYNMYKINKNRYYTPTSDSNTMFFVELTGFFAPFPSTLRPNVPKSSCFHLRAKLVCLCSSGEGHLWCLPKSKLITWSLAHSLERWAKLLGIQHFNLGGSGTLLSIATKQDNSAVFELQESSPSEHPMTCAVTIWQLMTNSPLRGANSMASSWQSPPKWSLWTSKEITLESLNMFHHSFIMSRKHVPWCFVTWTWTDMIPFIILSWYFSVPSRLPAAAAVIPCWIESQPPQHSDRKGSTLPLKGKKTLTHNPVSRCNE